MERSKKRLHATQRALGAGLLLVSVLMLCMAYHGETPIDHDCTAVLLTLPLALYLIFAKEIIIV